jgi:putative nucleotidyltransferase with HDIG domain
MVGRQATLQDIVTKVEQLPQPPQVALRVTRMLEDLNCSAQQLADVIRLDPNMTSQVLRLCNSAAYGFSRKIATVKEAVAMLGFNTLKSLVYTILSHSAFDRAIKGYGLERGALWTNAVTCAVYAKFIAEQRRLVDPELAYTGAILRDIGKLVLGEFVGANYGEIETLAQKEGIDFVDAEAQVIGFSHTLVGMKIAEKWNLPDKLVKVIRYHHAPSTLPKGTLPDDVKLVTIVHLADVFTMMVGSGIGSDGMMYSLDGPAIKALGIDLDGPYLETTLAQLVDLNSVVKSLTDSFLAPVGS